MSDCIFCKIIAGEIPASKVYEDEQILAFLDISQVTPGHTLIVPKEHYRNLLEMDAARDVYKRQVIHISNQLVIKAFFHFHVKAAVKDFLLFCL